MFNIRHCHLHIVFLEVYYKGQKIALVKSSASLPVLTSNCVNCREVCDGRFPRLIYFFLPAYVVTAESPGKDAQYRDPDMLGSFPP